MPLLPNADPLLTLGVIIVAGVLFGSLAKRISLPAVTGQILAGLLLGPVLHVFGEDALAGLRPLTSFALGLMTVSVGAHLNLKRMRNAGKRLAWLFVLELVLTPIIVVTAMLTLPDIEWNVALLLGAIAISTAPATIVALVKETRARGVLVKTLVAAVALNNVACILAFEMVRALAFSNTGIDAPLEHLGAMLDPLRQLGVAILLGATAAAFLQFAQRYIVRSAALWTASVLAILLTLGAADALQASPLLACLVLGMVQSNLSPDRDKLIDSLFSDLEPAILAVFFTLAGMGLHFDHMQAAGLAGAVFFAARFVSKLLCANLAMRKAGATKSLRRYLGPALLPQAGLAIGLVLLLQNDPRFTADPERLQLLLTVILTVVTLNELVGPILARWALKRSGEAGKDRARLLDFVQEQNILTDFQATTKEEAIELLVDHLIRSKHLTVDRETLLKSVLDREAQASTCFGAGLAVPHAILPGDHNMVGVIALSKGGIDLPTPDGQPVHCMVLLGTSENERQRHLQVLATLARIIGKDEAIRDRLFNASSPAHASEVLHGEDSEDFNVFTDEEE
ncbi:MAG: PTS system fructose-specific IIC component [Planctomycetota bacterium]|jgi:PTS system fructose-specific IIC component